MNVERAARDAPQQSEALHGNAPDKAAAALLLIDVINGLDFFEECQHTAVKG